MLNELTKRLYAEGWTRDNHPSNVYWSDFENFGYKWEAIKDTVWETGCGMLAEGRTVSTSDTSYGGITYCPENNNPLIRCPYGRRDCPHQKIKALAKFCMCVCKQSEKPYIYDHSVEKAENDLLRLKQDKYIEITGGQYCACVVDNNGYEPGYYKISFDVQRCINLGCSNQVCSITKKKRDLTKCNIFYDIRREWKTRIGFLDDTKVTIEKGCKVFKKPIARTDAELWLAKQKAEYNPFRSKSTIIGPHLTREDRSMEYFSDHHRKWPGYDYFEFHYSVENIRIAKSEQRDLLKDLQDTEAGIEVFHVSDKARQEVKKKKDDREKRAADKKKKVEKKQLAFFNSHWNEPEFARLFIMQFGQERYEAMMREKQDEQAGSGQQLSLF